MDWDGDGRLDIIVGDRPGYVHFFKRLDYGNIYLEEQALLEVAGERIQIDHNSAPSFTDWDGNGVPDLVIGALNPIPAGLYLLMNTGELYEPEFLTIDTVLSLGNPIELTTAYPDFHDMNGDGLQEMLVGSSNGTVACYVNSGTEQQPVYDQKAPLVANGEVINFGTYVRQSVCNWNSDGTPDLLIADDSGMVFLFTGIPSAGTEEQEQSESAFNVLQNPVMETISLQVSLQTASQITINVYSMDGREQLSLYSGTCQEGVSQMEFSLPDLSQGVYLVNCSTEDQTFTETVTVII